EKAKGIEEFAEPVSRAQSAAQGEAGACAAGGDSIGFLNGTSPNPHAPMVAAFRQDLERNRICRGQEPGDRIPLSGGPIRSLAGPRTWSFSAVLPPVPERPGARVGGGVRGELAVELGE